MEEEQGTKCASYLANSCHLGSALRPGGTQKGRRRAGRSVVNGSAHISEISLGPPLFWRATLWLAKLEGVVWARPEAGQA